MFSIVSWLFSWDLTVLTNVHQIQGINKASGNKKKHRLEVPLKSSGDITKRPSSTLTAVPSPSRWLGYVKHELSILSKKKPMEAMNSGLCF